MKKKGFTLIELLAVIVVLSVILVVAVPKIIDIIERADKKAYENSVNLMVEAARIDYQTKNVKGEEISLPVTYIYEENEQINKEEVGELKFKGDKAYSGTITINEKGKIIVENLVSKNKKWCAVKEEGETKVKVGKASELGCIVGEEEKIEDKKACELEKDIIEGIEVYYIDSESDLYELSKEVNSGTNFSGKIVKLRNNLDMSNVKNKCGLESFEPIGTSSTPFSGTFEGNAKTISNLEINKPDQDYVGLFGYNVGTIKGLTLENIEITGNDNVGGLAGYSGGNVSEIVLSGNIEGNSNVGGLLGTGAYVDGTISLRSSIVNANVKGKSAVGGAVGYNAQTVTGIVIESGDIQGITFCGANDGAINSYYSDKVSVITVAYVGTKYDSRANGNINAYEGILDTYIGGDDDNSGYYFDYNSKGELVIKSTKKDPITFNLKGSGTEADPYLIGSYQDWKESTTKADLVGVVFKLTNDIDFSGKNFYMLGSYQNRFSGHLDGDGHKLKGIETKGGYYQGIIGYIDSNSAIVENITIDGMKTTYMNDYIGAIAGYNMGTIKGVNLKNIEITGYDNVGGLAGYSGGNVSEIVLSGNVEGNSNVGGLLGTGAYVDGTISLRSSIVNVNVKGKSAVGGAVGYNAQTVTGIIIESGDIQGITFCGANDGAINSYYSDKVSVITVAYVGTLYESKHVNDLTYYDSLLDSSNNPIIESKYTGDVNGTGYFFDYGSDGKIYVVKAY